MPSTRRRILELALESLTNRKARLDDEIAAVTRELRRGGSAPRERSAGAGDFVAAEGVKPRKGSRFTKAERDRRSARMKAYWEKWRKGKAGRK